MSVKRFITWRRLVLLLVVAIAFSVAAYARFLGYYNGPIYTVIRAKGAPRQSVSGTAAIFLSSDMGFNTGMGPRIAARIAEHGIPVVGVNSLTAFSSSQSPQEAEALVREATDKALALPGIRQVVLIGQSFGANILIYGADSLPQSLRERVRMVGLVVPTDTTLFRATPGGIIELGHHVPALPAARQLKNVPVLCIHGKTEPRSLCPLWQQSNVDRMTLPGDHFLREDDALVAATLLHSLQSHQAAVR